MEGDDELEPVSQAGVPGSGGQVYYVACMVYKLTLAAYIRI